jgi:hypothetical protein
MIRTILAAAVALALSFAAPVLACPNCHDCPNKDKVAANDEAPKDGDKDKKAAKSCHCHNEKDTGPCKCGDKCQCEGKAEKKDEKKS